MENKDKEAILNNIPLDEEGHREFFTKKEIYQVMESIASQNEELIKENERLGHIIDEVDFKLSMMEDYAHGEVGNEITRLRKTISELLGGKTINKITQLQSTIDEKNKEITELKKCLNDFPGFNTLQFNPDKVAEWIKQVNELIPNNL